MRKLEVLADDKYRVGSLIYQAIGREVLVTRDSGKLIESVAAYEYENTETAKDAAYNMARRQIKA